MAKIGGNIKGSFQTKTTIKNEIGEGIQTWTDVISCVGWLDLRNGESKYTSFNAKVEESDHVFICDYHPAIYAFADQDSRMIIKGKMYDVLLIDNPMEMDEQLEIYLRKVGG